VVLNAGEVAQIGRREEVLPGLLGEAGTCAFYRGA